MKVLFISYGAAGEMAALKSVSRSQRKGRGRKGREEVL